MLTDPVGLYAAIVVVPSAYGENVNPEVAVASLASGRDVVLAPGMDIASVTARFDEAHTEELAVIGGDRRPLGVVSETYVRRRYAEEPEKAQRELFGER